MTTSIQWFLIVIILFTIWVIALTIANVVYYNRIRTGGIVQTGEATALVWISVITAIVAFVIFCIALWFIFSGRTIVCAPPPTAVATVVTPSKTTTYTVTTPPRATQVSVPVTSVRTAPTTVVTTPAPTTVTVPTTVYPTSTVVPTTVYPTSTVVQAPPSFSNQSVSTAIQGIEAGFES